MNTLGTVDELERRKRGVFTLPVPRLFIEGELQLARNFSLGEVKRQIDRRYGLWLASRGEE